MWKRIQCATAVIAAISASCVCAVGNAALTVTESEGGGPTPTNLVASLLDAGSSYTLDPTSVSISINATSGSYTSSLRALGSFTGGLTPAGTLLPAPNQNSSGNAQYAGGIGIASGICLCTGASSDTDMAGLGLGPERGVGSEGPNNGEFGANEGEIGVAVLGDFIIDNDFDEHVFNGQLVADPNLQDSGDPTVLEFKITLQTPGFLRLRFVFGSDEYQHWTLQFNDSFAILVKKDACANAEFENIAVLKDPAEANPAPFTLADLVDCDAPIFKQNQLAPAPPEFLTSAHAIDDTPGSAPFEYEETG